MMEKYGSSLGETAFPGENSEDWCHFDFHDNQFGKQSKQNFRHKTFYSEHTSLIENEQLLKEFADLTGLYQYLQKDKKAKPIVIIDKTDRIIPKSKKKKTKK